jgi:dienelactone hydrolase
VPVRGITLARMGMVAFMYDMVGYNDSHQFDHRFENWSEEERQRLELWGIHPFALQLWSSIRVVDFLQDLPYVDGDNIACTGASGGGTQTFALTGVDDRVKVAAPVNMISHTMQGGCICENAPLIRVNASNMEVGALAAPRPLMMVSATGDWTKETPDVEYPAIRGIYKLYDATDRVAMVQIDAPHNYNQDSREAVYRFFGKWVLGDEAKWATFEEPEATPEPVEQARVFSDDAKEEHDSADAIVARMIEERRTRVEESLPKDRDSLKAYQSGVGQSLFDVTGVMLPEPGDVKAREMGSVNCDGGTMEQLVIGREGDAIAGLLFKPEGAARGSVLVVHTMGKLAFVDAKTGGPGELVSRLMADGLAVLAIDPFMVGESLSDGRERTYGRFRTTFMPTNTGYRIQDVVTSLAYLRSRGDLDGVRGVAGLGEAGIWCLFASALDGRVPITVVDANGFDPNDDEAWLSRQYMACVQSSGGVKAAAAMVAPRNLAVFNTSGGFDLSGVTEVFGDALTFGHDRWSAERIADQF